MQNHLAFKYADNPDANVLLGVYRHDKCQLDWILGLYPRRYDVIYNVRKEGDLFSHRDGGVAVRITIPDYVLIYDSLNVSSEYHLFPCVSKSEKTEEEMRSLHYPDPHGDYVTFLLGEEVPSEPVDISKLIKTTQYDEAEPVFAPRIIKASDVARCVDYEFPQPQVQRRDFSNVVRFIDLFAGIGGIRCGLEQAVRECGKEPVCVFTSEIKPYAVKVLNDNHPGEDVNGDITKVDTASIPDFDILCAGFPCQAFSAAGKRQGFADTRGTMFFQVERILRDKQPQGFILENVEGLVNHDKGRTLQVIKDRLDALGYKFDYKVLNSKYFGVPQERKRIYIVGTKKACPNLEGFDVVQRKLADILESNKPTVDSPFVRLLLDNFKIENLYGKSIKDKRGGDDNIHSWDLQLKGPVSLQQKSLLDTLLKERRKKKWAEIIGIEWMDGMPLTFEQISTFYESPTLKEDLDYLAKVGYLRLEHPKKLVSSTTAEGVKTTSREYDTSKPMGYNIVTGKLSFEINKVLSPNEIAPTLVAMDMQKLYVADNGGLRRLTLREGLRIFGYPDDFKLNVKEKDGFDLLGNTVVVPVIKAVAKRLLDAIYN